PPADAQHGPVRDPRHRRGDLPERPRHRVHRKARPDQGRGPHRPAAAAAHRCQEERRVHGVPQPRVGFAARRGAEGTRGDAVSTRSALPYSGSQRLLLGLCLPALALIAWEFWARFGSLPSYLIAPTAIVAATWDMAVSGELWQHAAQSLLRALAGYVIGAVCGIGMGLLAGIARPVERFYEPIISLTYPVP